MQNKILAVLALSTLVACNNNANEGAQPNQIGDHESQVHHAEQPRNVSNTQQHPSDNPYNHNYNGTYSGAQNTTTADNIRSAQQVQSRVSEAAEEVAGVERAISIVQGADIVVAVDTDRQENLKALEQQVKQAISKKEQGYNVYVSTNSDINEQIRELFKNMNNVKTSNVTPGIGEIIYKIGQTDGHH